MGRKKIEIEKITDNNRKNVSFCKRRQGLFKKAKQFCELFNGAEVAAMAVSPAGKPHVFGHHSAIHRFLKNNGNNGGAGSGSGEREECSSASGRTVDRRPGVAVANDDDDDLDQREKFQKEKGKRKEGFWWDEIDDESMKNYSIEELESLIARMEELRSNVLKRTEELEQRRLKTNTAANNHQDQEDDDDDDDGGDD